MLQNKNLLKLKKKYLGQKEAHIVSFTSPLIPPEGMKFIKYEQEKEPTLCNYSQEEHFRLSLLFLIFF